ncbi:MAG: copper resistance protein B [Pseudomonadota bacterium]
MTKLTVLSGLILCWLQTGVLAMGNADPLISKVVIDQFETRDAAHHRPLVLEAQGWVGYDLHKLRWKADLEWVEAELEEAVVQVLYSRAADAYWNWQIGWQYQGRPRPEQHALVLGVQGLAPYWLETDAALLFGKQGQVSAQLKLEQEVMLTQRWVLIPELGAQWQRRVEPGMGSGADLSLGLRLAYEIRREFAPYVGLVWQRRLAGLAEAARRTDEAMSETQWVAGVKLWF